MLKAKPIRFYEVTNTPILFMPNAQTIITEFNQVEQQLIKYYKDFGNDLLKQMQKWELPTHFDISEYYYSKSSKIDTDKI